MEVVWSCGLWNGSIMWIGHVDCGKVYIEVEGGRPRGRQRKAWLEVVSQSIFLWIKNKTEKS